MSDIKVNGDYAMNGTERKSPFVIGVAGGTASGKVIQLLIFYLEINEAIYYTSRVQCAPKLWKNLDKWIWIRNNDKSYAYHKTAFTEN